MPTPNRSSNFQYIFSNSFNITVSANEAVIRFGIYEDPNSPNDSIYDQTAVALSPVGAKILANALAEIIARFEAETKTVILLPDDHDKTMKALISSGIPNNTKKT